LLHLFTFVLFVYKFKLLILKISSIMGLFKVLCNIMRLDTQHNAIMTVSATLIKYDFQHNDTSREPLLKGKAKYS